VSLFARAVFVLLVAATFSAFFAAQRLKSAPPVATIKRITQHFSPNGDGRRDVAHIRVRVRKDDDVTIAVVDDAGTEVRRLATAVPATADRAVRVRWDGRTASGATAPEGTYRLRVSLRRGGRAVTLNPAFSIDTTAPRPTVLAGGPDGTQWITGPVAGPVPFRVRVVSQRSPTRMRVLRTDLGAPREVAAFTLPAGVRDGEWDGMAGGAPAPPGTYQLVALVRDQAGNVGRSAPDGPGPVRGQPGVSVRALLARPPADPVRAGEPVKFAVDSRGRPYRWRIFRVGGAEQPQSKRARRRARRNEPPTKGRKPSGGELTVRAPRGPSGVYVLKVRSGANATSVPFTVQAVTAAPILVVLPAATWFGLDTLDDDRDGLPNTLENGSSAAYPRLLAGGLPAGFGDRVGALLAFLDSQKIHYDLTTDLTLAASRSGLTGERQGVLLAGPFRWVSTELARRLRRYVSEGGRVASFGAESLLRGVDVARDRLLRPLPPTDTDPFGARLRPVRRLPGAEPLQPIADEGDTGLLTGVEALPGFSQLEESEPSDRVRVALAAVDLAALEQAETTDEPLPETYPAVALSELGKGMVIRVGLPEWGAQLRAGSVPVQQLTRNIADILRGASPEIRSF
jgi:N,N-dimethylformamidase beta subunit-like, C-terminal/FlgD Ig-like domain